MSNDPSRVVRCECPNTGKLDADFSGWYDADRELPFVNHAPGECACTNELARYRSDDGAVRWLCSCCHTFGDVRLSDSDGSRMAETPEEAARGEAEPARAEGIAQPLDISEQPQ